jgi:hypothetical protein
MNDMSLIEEGGKHFYATEGMRFPSVTTVIGLLANPGFEAWKRATPDWEEVGALAANLDTSVHKAIELYLNGQPHALKSYVQSGCFDAFIHWKNQYEFEMIETELRVKSEKGYAGTFDLECELDGMSYIIDLKTTNQIYPDYLLQLAAYRFAYVEMTKRDIQKMAVLRLDKRTGGYEFREYSHEEYQRGIKMFLLLVEYWWLRNLE